MPRTCTKEFTLHVEPAPVDCYTNSSVLGDLVGNILMAASTPATPDAAFGLTGGGVATLRKYNLLTRNLISIGASPAGYPGAWTGSSVAASATHAYSVGYDALNSVASAFIKHDPDLLTISAYILFAGGNIGVPRGTVYATDQDAIFCIATDPISTDEYLVRLNCAADSTTITTLTSVASEFTAQQVGYKASNSRAYIPITATIGGATRIEERDSGLALTNTLGGAGFYGNHNFYGCVYCPSNDRIYVMTFEGAPTFAYYILCINPADGSIDDQIGPIVTGGGTDPGRQMSYDATHDLVYTATNPILAIQPSDNSIHCSYPTAGLFFKAAPGVNSLAVPLSITSVTFHF